MKRYVKEFANDQMKISSQENKSKIKNVLRHYERGYITSVEAVKVIADMHYENYDNRNEDEINMDKNEIRVKVNGGYLVAGINTYPEDNGIYIIFETDDGDIVDVVLTECKAENDYKKIDVIYIRKKVYTEEWTRKYTLDNNEIYRAINGL